MTFAKVNPGGWTNNNSTITATQANQLDANNSNSVDKTGDTVAGAMEFTDIDVLHPGADADADLGVGNSSSDVFDRRFGRLHTAYAHWREDFMVSAIADLPQMDTIGSTAEISNGPGGVMELITLGAGSTAAAVWLDAHHFYPQAGSGYIEYLVHVVNPITSVKFELDMSDDSGSNTAFTNSGVEGLTVVFDTDAAHTNWVFAGRASTVLTTDTSSVAVSGNTWYRISIVVNPNGSGDMYINGALEASLSAGEIGFGSSGLRPNCRVIERSASARSMLVDRMEFWAPPNAGLI